MAKKKKIKAVIFDIDNVLIDTTASYRVALKKTAEFFLGKILSMDDVDEIQNKIEDDCDAAELLIQNHGGDFRKHVIIKKFQEYYLGRKFDGLVKNEKRLVKDDVLKKLKKYKLAILTGRPKIEAEFGLKRFKMWKYFKAIVTKNDANGLLKVIKKLGVKDNEVIYVGGNLATLRTVNNAGIASIGVCSPKADKTYMKNLFKSDGAEIVLNNVSEIVKAI